MGKQSKIFLSYAIEDRKKVEEIYDSLIAEGFSPWMDSRDLKGGDIWENKIAENLTNSDSILIFLSSNSINKQGFVQAELKTALSLSSKKSSSVIFIIPVRLEEIPLPKSLSDIKSADLFRKDGWNELVRALKYRTGNEGAVEEVKATIRNTDTSEKDKRHIFVAMPFSIDMSDVYVYGIHRSAEINGFTCERIDRNSFTGSILSHIKQRISSATAVIADLSGGNPNVYLELGYAWGCEIPTILITKDVSQLHFDVRDQRCIQYESIRALEEKLTQELANLKTMGKI